MWILKLSFKKNNYCSKIERVYVLGSINVSMDPQGDRIIHKSQWNWDGHMEAKVWIHLYFHQ